MHKNVPPAYALSWKSYNADMALPQNRPLVQGVCCFIAAYGLLSAGAVLAHWLIGSR